MPGGVASKQVRIITGKVSFCFDFLKVNINFGTDATASTADTIEIADAAQRWRSIITYGFHKVGSLLGWHYSRNVSEINKTYTAPATEKKKNISRQ